MALAIQQLKLRIAVALPVRFLLSSVSSCLWFRATNSRGTIVALDLIALDTFANDIAAFKHHAAEHFSGVRAVGFSMTSISRL
jgi:hypothetical protein